MLDQKFEILDSFLSQPLLTVGDRPSPTRKDLPLRYDMDREQAL